MSLEAFFGQTRRHFSGLSRGVGADLAHLNNAAGSEVPDRAIDAMADWMRTNYCNEGYGFRRLEASHALVHLARAATGDLVGAAADEIGFGPSTTANLFFVTRALGRTLLRPGDRVLVSEACHEANVAPWLTLADYGARVEFIPMRDDTHLDYDWLDAHVDERTRIITVGASSNATGTVHDLDRVAAAARRVSALFSVDAAHFVPHRPVDFRARGADLLFFSIYKCFGPHLGAFAIKKSLCERLPPFGNPRPKEEDGTAARFECGTRNFEALAGWLGTIAYLEQLGRELPRRAHAPAEGRRAALVGAMAAAGDWEAELTRYGDERLRAVPGLELYAQPPRHPGQRLGVFCFNLAGVPAARVTQALERAGVEAVGGHNGAVRTMGRFAGPHGGSGVRLSLAHYSTRAELDRAVDCLLALRR